MPENSWPELPLESWKDTYATLHMWTQIVGKVRLALAPHVNHWWQVPLYVNSCGLTTSAIPYAERTFEVQFDFAEHQLTITVSDGQIKSMPLRPQSVAAFYAEFMSALRSLGIKVKIWPMPVEIPDPIRFDRDEQHASYDRVYVESFLENSRAGGWSSEEISFGLHRETQSDPFLLGEFRPRIHEVLGTPRCRTPRR